MSRWRGQSIGVQPLAGYTVNKGGGVVPVIDVDAKVEIDLTQIDDNDEDDITFTGMRWDTMTGRQQRAPERGGRRGKEREGQRRVWEDRSRSSSASNRGTPVEGATRGSTASSSRSWSTLSRLNANPARAFDTGPPSTTRSEINEMRSHSEPPDDPEPPRKRLRTTDGRPTHEHYLPEAEQQPFEAPNYAPPPEQDYSYSYGDMMDIDTAPPAYEPYEHLSEHVRHSPPPAKQPLPPGTTKEQDRSSPVPKAESTLELKAEPVWDVKPTTEDTSRLKYEDMPRPKIEDMSRPKIEDISRQKIEDIPESSIEPETDTEEEYECLHSGYNIKDKSLWKVPKQNTARLESDVIGEVNEWTIPSPKGKERERGRRLRTSGAGKGVRPPKGGFIWDLLEQLDKAPSMSRHSAQKPSKLKRDSIYGKDHSAKAMHMQATFKVAPGAINRIEQCHGWLAIASSCTGGQADEPEEQINPYNRSGSLLTWNGQYHILTGHFDEKLHGKKHYTINDVRFNHSGDYFVSAGMDKKTRVWKRPQGAVMYSGGYELDAYSTGVPHELAFQPQNANTNVVAVGAKDVHIYSSLEPVARRTAMTLNLSPKSHHSTGSIRWDVHRPHVLYASSEPQDDEFDGVHKAFDVNRGKTKLIFNATAAGDAMAVDRVLALATRGAENSFLQLFDITGSNKNCIQEVSLEPFSKKALVREVSCMAFSPDGIYLSLARSDNSVHVYDSRMLYKGTLQKYQHQNPHFVSPESTLFGVTYAQWVSTRSGQYALMSGGEDGCVRLWNPMWSNEEPSNGRKIVEVNSDIGFFSVGDPHKEEYDLVVGDSSGEVTIFTGLLNHL